MDEFRIRIYCDIEPSLLKALHSAYRVWRVLQQLNRETRSGGKLDRSTVESQVAAILEVSKENVRKSLAGGNGVFWNITPDKSTLYLIGYKKVYAHFGCEPQQRPPTTIKVSRISGNIAKFRAFVIGVKMAHHQAAYNYAAIEENRNKIAKAMGVSLPTLRAAAKAGWIEIQRRFVEVGAALEPEVHGHIRIKRHTPGVNQRIGETIMLVDGKRMIVRATHNAYRSALLVGKQLEPKHVERRVAWYTESVVPKDWNW